MCDYCKAHNPEDEEETEEEEGTEDEEDDDNDDDGVTKEQYEDWKWKQRDEFPDAEEY